MTETLTGIAIGAVLAGLIYLALRGRGGGAMTVDVRHSLEKMRAVGELVVFRLITQQIVTAEQHAAGRFKDYFKWLISTKKLAVIIEYGIDFRYNLRDARMKIESTGDNSDGVRLTMPPCEYHTHIRDIKFYDERNSRWLPWLLGDITGGLGPGFDESQKNKLLEAARAEADAKARLLVEQLQNEAQSSARQTLEALGKGFGVDRVDVVFTTDQPRQTQPTTIANQPAGSAAGAAASEPAP